MNDQMRKDGTPRITRIGVVGVPVSDQDRALDFYLGALEFEKRVDVAYGDARWIEVAPPGAATTIALVPLRGDARGGVETGIRLVVDTLHDDAIGDVRAIHAGLLARNVDVDPEVVQVEGLPPMFSLRDPDGNVLRIVARHRQAARRG